MLFLYKKTARKQFPIAHAQNVSIDAQKRFFTIHVLNVTVCRSNRYVDVFKCSLVLIFQL